METCVYSHAERISWNNNMQDQVLKIPALDGDHLRNRKLFKNNPETLGQKLTFLFWRPNAYPQWIFPSDKFEDKDIVIWKVNINDQIIARLTNHPWNIERGIFELTLTMSSVNLMVTTGQPACPSSGHTRALGTYKNSKEYFKRRG